MRIKAKNIKLELTYDGTEYLGWQKTKMGPSIEEVLENALSKILQHEIKLQAASRTDAGVNAVGQVVNFFTRQHLEFGKLLDGLNGVLPKDIVATGIEEAAESFHPTIDAKGKTYHYYVCYGKTQLPHQRHHAWHYPFALDIEAIKTAIPFLIGERDFSAFCNMKTERIYSDSKRRIETIELLELTDEHLRFNIRGNHFLYKMVRILVGTLVYVGHGKINPEEIPNILQSGDRTRAGVTAPAHGLFLHKVFY